LSFKILVPVDLEEESSWKKPLAVAFAQAQKLHGTVTVMTVVPDLTALLDWRYAIRGETGGSAGFDMRSIVEDAEQRLRQIVQAAAPAGMKVATLARHGTVYEQILDVAAELDVDQIVMAAHKPTMTQYLIGEVTSRVVRHAKCSVNVVRGD
jgi:nucleotide-binding universal stress UspA family protein